MGVQAIEKHEPVDWFPTTLPPMDGIVHAHAIIGTPHGFVRVRQSDQADDIDMTTVSGDQGLPKDLHHRFGGAVDHREAYEPGNGPNDGPAVEAKEKKKDKFFTRLRKVLPSFSVTVTLVSLVERIAEWVDNNQNGFDCFN